MLTWVVPLVLRAHSEPEQCLGVTGWIERPSEDKKEERGQRRTEEGGGEEENKWTFITFCSVPLAPLRCPINTCLCVITTVSPGPGASGDQVRPAE